MTAFIEMTAVTDHLRVSNGDNLVLLQDYLESACDVVEQQCGPIAVRTAITEQVVAPRGIAVLQYGPSALTSVPVGVVGDYTFDQDTGVVRRTDGGAWSGSVTYTAGYATPPAWARQAALFIVEHLWRTRRGMGGRTADAEAAVPGTGYLIPNRAATLMEPHRLAGGFA